MQKKKLGILLSTPPSHPNITTVTHLCEEGLKSDVDVYLYLIDEGVKNLTNQAQHRESRRAGCQASRVMSEENNLRGFVAMTYAPR